ncbi:LysM peptidoglycan-binding domain-containing protein [Enterococcus sp. BWR-S5]|uniref:LysM peptidoglycan-binding domain-containing protein n=1 Tax=Enterococcus sp. BWR-S5 TaxID=2787714 RepID=UPI001920FD38|nr:LysM peptidoglycan-binding domain-containing protein [Enterococcus sp. BWR-S5]
MKKFLFMSLFSGVLLTTGLTSTKTAYANPWTANTPDMLKIQDGQTSYTMILGDTLWAISQRTNLTVQALADINGINLNLGEQYLLPVGRTIYFDGNTVIVKEINGNVISETVVSDEQKINPNQDIGVTVDPSVTTPTTPVSPVVPDTSVKPAIPTEPTKPVEPTNPIDPVDPTEPINPAEPTDPEPELPQPPYTGTQIPGVENGIVGTYSDETALMDAMDDYKLTNDLHGSDWDYVILNNGYGFYAVWVTQ